MVRESFDFKFTSKRIQEFTDFDNELFAIYIKFSVNRYKFFAYRNPKESVYLEKFVKYQ